MKKLALLLIVALSLGGCAGLTRAFDAATSSSLSPQTVVIARNSFDAIESSANNYLNLTRCDKTTSKACRTKEISAILGPAVLNARKARNDLVAFQKSHPDQLGTQGLYDALELSITTLTGIMSTYHIGVTQ